MLTAITIDRNTSKYSEVLDVLGDIKDRELISATSAAVRCIVNSGMYQDAKKRLAKSSVQPRRRPRN